MVAKVAEKEGAAGSPWRTKVSSADWDKLDAKLDEAIRRADQTLAEITSWAASRAAGKP